MREGARRHTFNREKQVIGEIDAGGEAARKKQEEEGLRIEDENKQGTKRASKEDIERLSRERASHSRRR